MLMACNGVENNAAQSNTCKIFYKTGIVALNNESLKHTQQALQNLL